MGKYINKSYRVSTSKTPSADIITATLYFIPQLDNNLQKNVFLKPVNWRASTESNMAIAEHQKKMKDVVTDSNTHFRIIRNNYIEKM